ncbi:PH domain-containing protein [Sporolactobacillus vineae]|uniref:PH domain-containing protein n=1 Tax=Sporolactobacillus vineae TaxID=444463 RepID=UPI00028826FF|nr:PH domain-containing protein [Sporolactobacillus vineae]
MEKQHLDPGIVTVWRQRSLMTNLIFWLILAGFFTCTVYFSWPGFFYLIAGTLAILVALHLILYVLVIPVIRYRTFFYTFRQSDFLIRDGVFVIRQVSIPLARVQNVTTEQGPLLRRYHLVSVSITTAADTQTIPALNAAEAHVLRDRIAEQIKENGADEL